MLFALSSARNSFAEEKQTVEGAQQFLERVLVKQQAASQVFWNKGDGSIINGVRNFGPISEFSSAGRCKQRVIAVFPQWRDVPANKDPYDMVWDFSKLVEVSAPEKGNEIVMHFVGLAQPRYLKIASGDLAARVAFALTFLQHNCDATATTGF
nr:hypothetical protein [uncultured Duganella sp.]